MSNAANPTRTVTLKTALVEVTGSFDAHAVVSVSLAIVRDGKTVATIQSYDIDHKVAPESRLALHAAVREIEEEIEATAAWQEAHHKATAPDRLDAWHRDGTARVLRAGVGDCK